MLNDLRGLLMRFRLHLFAIVADLQIVSWFRFFFDRLIEYLNKQ